MLEFPNLEMCFGRCDTDGSDGGDAMHRGTRGDCPCGQLHMQVSRLGHQAGQILVCNLKGLSHQIFKAFL
jgi:hypothetical protein